MHAPPVRPFADFANRKRESRPGKDRDLKRIRRKGMDGMRGYSSNKPNNRLPWVPSPGAGGCTRWAGPFFEGGGVKLPGARADKTNSGGAGGLHHPAHGFLAAELVGHAGGMHATLDNRSMAAAMVMPGCERLVIESPWFGHPALGGGRMLTPSTRG